MARRKDHTREELSELILTTAWNIIGKEGFEKLTARAIAKNIGYSPGTIYNTFDSMDDLYLKVNARVLDILYETLNDPAHQNPRRNAENNMISMASAYMAFARDYRPYWMMLFRLQLSDARKIDPAYQEKVEQLFKPLERLLSPFFEAHEARQLKMASHTLWASIHGLCFLQETGKIPLVDQNQKAAEKMANFLIKTFVKGLGR